MLIIIVKFGATLTMNTVRIIELPKIPDERGNLSFIEENRHIPFKIARAYWIYDVPGGESRDAHAFRETDELIVALSGAFDVVVSDGKETRSYTLNRSYHGLLVPRRHWRELTGFSTNSVALVLASRPYDEADYIWNIDEL